MPTPLHGIRVLDLTTVQMGPWCTRVLADYGADVIKVESPDGDTTRLTGAGRNRGMGPTFLHNARGKRDLAVNLKHPAAKDIFARLLPSADAIASNIRPAALGRLGLDYESVRKVNPGIVYLSMVGYGSAGRYAGSPAYDDLIQAASGVSMLPHRRGGEPRYIPMAAIDRIVGSEAASALLAGLLAKARTGIGQMIEIPMFETMARFVLSEHMQGATFDPPTGGMGYARTLSQGRRPYETKDGFVVALPYNDGQWRRFFQAIGKEEILHTDPRFKDIASRTANIDSLYDMIAEEMKHRTTDEWLDLLRANDIPGMRPHTLESLLEDPHLNDAGFFTWIDHPSEGRIRAIRDPGTWSETPPRAGHVAPRLGQHTREVLAEAGYSADEIDALIEQKAVAAE